MAETKGFGKNGRALGWLFAAVVLAAAIWMVVELLTDADEGNPLETPELNVSSRPAAAPVAQLGLRIS